MGDGMARPRTGARGAADNLSLPNVYAGWRTPERYRLDNIIGNGSYGTVTEALDKETQRPVAIKRVARVFEDRVDCKRILREIAILCRLEHENVVKLLDVCVPADLLSFDELYEVLEIADSDLKKLFRTQVFLTENHITTILYNLIVGLKYIHSAHILHRDLKPANCLVNVDCTVKICDFGLARTMDPETNDLNATPDEGVGGRQNPHSHAIQKQLTGHVVTRWYRAPELILLQENYNEKIDVWSVGCIFAELLGMMKVNVRHPIDRGPLFPGKSCFPLSPDQRHRPDRLSEQNTDQLKMIFDVLGTPSEEDIAELEKEDARRYCRLFPKAEPVAPLDRKFSDSSAEAKDLLKKMLVFNPRNRISVDQALEHPLFAKVRRPRPATEVPTEAVRLPFDDWSGLTENQLRYAFVREIQRFHPEVEIPEQLAAHAPPQPA